MHGQSFYKYLKKKCPGPLGVEAIPWSYTKFLVNRQGIPVGRYFFMKGPNSMEKDILAELDKNEQIL
jgi:glutathione peroxidase